jgi:hypothetical protein
LKGRSGRGRAESEDLQGYEEQDAIQRIVSTINIIAKEKVVMKRWLATDLKQLQEVEELAVHWQGAARKFNSVRRRRDN